MHVLPASAFPEVDSARRKQIGAWYTPAWLVEYVVDQVLARVSSEAATAREAPITVVDPACGDGRFLAAVRRRLGDRVVVTGVDIDPAALVAARTHLGDGAELILADALVYDWADRRFDVVIGNPPYLSQMAAKTTRNRRSDHGGGLYADAAVEFLALSLRLAASTGSQSALVLPASMLSTRDSAPIRRRAAETGSLEWFWWSPSLEFADANIRTCVFGWVSGSRSRHIARAIGSTSRRAVDVPATALQSATWASLIADQLGIPALPEAWRSTRLVADIGVANANFRDEYYGLVGAVAEAPSGSTLDGPPTALDGPPSPSDGFGQLDLGLGTAVAAGPFAPLVTSGLIDPGRCAWGLQPVRFNKVPYRAPVVDLTRLTPKMRRWADRKRVPKVLLANQTRVIEAVVDASGEWLPSVPVINVRPVDPRHLWHLAAALSNPVSSAIAALQGLGAGLSASAIRLSAPKVARLPIPDGDPQTPSSSWSNAATQFADGDVVAAGLTMLDAYEIDAPEVAAWWITEINRRISPATD